MPTLAYFELNLLGEVDDVPSSSNAFAGRFISMRLKGKVAIVTGAAAGIGAATAQAFAREGATVLLADHDSLAGEATTAAIAQSGGHAHFIQADMGEKSAIETMVGLASQRFGRIDVLHNNTAGSAIAPLGDITVEQWDNSLRLGLTPYWYASRCVLPHMIQAGGGSIIHTASISGLHADYGLGMYNTVKSAIINLSRSLALDYAKYNIRSNAVCPGIVFTSPFQKLQKINPELIKQLAESVPLGRFGTPEEIANVMLFLASEESSFVTGSTITVDGGRTAWTGTPSMLRSLQ